MIKEGGRVGISAVGHAGNTDVCNAISTLLQSLAGYIINTTEDCSVVLNSGEAYIGYPLKGNRDITRFMEISFMQLEKNFPDYVKWVAK